MSENTVIFLSATRGYPKDISANNTKVHLISKYLQKLGVETHIINSPLGDYLFPEKDNKYVERRSLGSNPFSNVALVINNLREISKFLKSFRRKEKVNIIIDYEFYPIFIYYFFLSKIYNLKIGVLYHELHKSFKTNNLVKKISYYLFDNTFGYLVQFILPISEYLSLDSRKFKKPVLLLPILAEYKGFFKKNLKGKDYFTYVGHSGYGRAIDYILDAAVRCHTFKVKLILHGNKIDYYQRRLELAGLTDRVEILSGLTEQKLFHILSHAKCNLIPLFEINLQDRARFSQKIAEYLSVGRPIITNNVGEVSRYFQHNLNSFILEDNSISSLVDMINKVMVMNERDLQEIGLQGYALGSKYFCAEKNTLALLSFINSIK